MKLNLYGFTICQLWFHDLTDMVWKSKLQLTNINYILLLVNYNTTTFKAPKSQKLMF